MATPPVVSYQFPPTGPALAPYVGQDFADIIKYISDRNDGTAAWDSLVITGASTFNSAITITPTTNQIVLGTTRTVTLTAPTPATTSRVVTFPDLTGDYSVVGTISNQTIAGVKDFTGQLLGKGTATNDDAAAGYIGEYQSTNQTSFVSAGSSNTWFNITSMSLSAGDWDVTGVVMAQNNGATTTANTTEIAISVNSGNTTSDHVIDLNWVPMVTPQTSPNQPIGTIPVYRLKLSGTTTVYLKAIATYTGGPYQARGRLSARRTR